MPSRYRYHNLRGFFSDDAELRDGLRLGLIFAAGSLTPSGQECADRHRDQPALLQVHKLPWQRSKCRDSCDTPPENKGMHIMCAFVCIYSFKVHHVAHDLLLFGNAVAAVHVARHPRGIQRLADVVALDH